MSERDERLGAILRPARVEPSAVITTGWMAIRADHDPTAGPVWLVEHAVRRHRRQQRLAVIVAERRPWGETVDWLIECMNRVPDEEVTAGASPATVTALRRYSADEFPGAGAVGRLAGESAQLVRMEVAHATADARWGVIDERHEWDDYGTVTRAVRDGDLLRVRAVHDFVFWMRRGKLITTDDAQV
jgi:hypothetical protein